MNIPKEWIEKAEFFHRSCKQRFKEGVYWAVCFEAQQAIEILLKGLQVAYIGVHEFTHDLSRLLRGLEIAGIEVPQELYVYADALTPHYTMARYPGRKPIEYEEDVGKRCLEYEKKIWEWAYEMAKDP